MERLNHHLQTPVLKTNDSLLNEICKKTSPLYSVYTIINIKHSLFCYFISVTKKSQIQSQILQVRVTIQLSRNKYLYTNKESYALLFHRHDAFSLMTIPLVKTWKILLISYTQSEFIIKCFTKDVKCHYNSFSRVMRTCLIFYIIGQQERRWFSLWIAIAYRHPR